MFLFILNSVTPKGTYAEVTVTRAAATAKGRPCVAYHLSATLIADPAVWNGPAAKALEKWADWLDAQEVYVPVDGATAGTDLADLKAKARAVAAALTEGKWPGEWREGDAAFQLRKERFSYQLN
jgi:hypothetical protein